MIIIPLITFWNFDVVTLWCQILQCAILNMILSPSFLVQSKHFLTTASTQKAMMTFNIFCWVKLDFIIVFLGHTHNFSCPILNSLKYLAIFAKRYVVGHKLEIGHCAFLWHFSRTTSFLLSSLRICLEWLDIGLLFVI